MNKQLRSYDGAMVSSKGKQNKSGKNLGNMTDECRHVGNHVNELPMDQKVVGKPPKGEGQRHRSQLNENVNTFISPPKNDLRKISVSPRVELMLNNDLFKKYLSRHGNLLEKLSQRQGRTRGTMKKAFSNLDLSKIDLEEELQPVTETQKSELNNGQSNIGETRVNNAAELNKSLHSQNPAIIRRRSMSLTGQNDPHYPELQEALRLNEPKQSGRSSRRSKFTLPSFEEFKRSRREKIAKGQAFVRDVMKNKENIPQSIISSLEDNEHPVFQKSDSECNVKNRIGKSVCNIEETVNDNQNTNGSITVPASHSASETLVNNSSQETCSDKREVNHVNKTHRKPREKPIIKQCERRERLKLSESFCAKSPEQSTSSPRRSKSLKNKGKVKETLNTERQISENASDPLELSTDGQSIYATLKIFSDEFKIPSQGYQESSEDDICSDNDKNISLLPNMCQNCKGDIENGHTVDTITVSQVNRGNYSGRSHSHTSASQRVILKASRKRKLPPRPQKSKSEDANDEPDKMHISKSCPRLSPSDNTALVNKKQSRPPHLELNRTHSCEVFGHELHSPLSPKSFSIENSPSYDKSATFNLPSSSSSNNGSDTDIPIRAANEAVSAWNNSNSNHTDSKMVVSRSTSDITHNMTDGNRRRRDRKQRPYKSDPFNGSPPSGKVSQGPGQPRLHEYPNFVNEVSLLELDEEDRALFQVDPHSKIKHRLSNISDVSTDSGVIGPDSIPDAPPSPSSSIFSQTSLFGGQDSAVEIFEGQTYTDADDKNNGDTECCTEKHAKERKETILEIRDTEINYGRDLRILKEEFYKPMKNNGLLTSEQLEDIFQNLEELIEVNRQFTERLQQAVDEAVDHGDEMLSSVVMGDLFLKSTNLIYTFEHYCINQSQATILLEQLEREKDILRIFLKVCQDEQPILRRMHLKSFLMVPVQRIMKYPLLLERLHRATSPDHHDRDRILSAKTKIEKILEQINARTRMASQVKLSKRKISEKKMITVTEKIEVTRVAMEVLGWHRNDVCDILTSQLLVAPQLNDQNWATKRLRNFKFTNVHAVLLTLGQGYEDFQLGELIHAEEECLLFPQRSQVIQAAVVLIKEKNGKFQTFREPFLLNRCIVNVDRDMEDVFELMELNKESCLFKSEDYNLYRLWLQNIKQQTLDLGSWRKRRNALPNIMIKHLV